MRSDAPPSPSTAARPGPSRETIDLLVWERNLPRENETWATRGREAEGGRGGEGVTQGDEEEDIQKGARGHFAMSWCAYEQVQSTAVRTQLPAVQQQTRSHTPSIQKKNHLFFWLHPETLRYCTVLY